MASRRYLLPRSFRVVPAADASVSDGRIDEGGAGSRRANSIRKSSRRSCRRLKAR